MSERYTDRELSAATLVPRATLRYWSTIGLLTPTATDDGYTAREFSVGLVLAEASRLGASGPILATIVERLAGDPVEWPTSIWLTARAVVLDEDSAAAAWVVHPRRVLAEAAPQLLLALAS